MDLIVGKKYVLMGEIFSEEKLYNNNSTFVYVGVDSADGMHEFMGCVDGSFQWAFDSQLDNPKDDTTVVPLN